MLYFTTGKPGNGKTLNVIQRVHKLQKENPNRAVYYHGVPLTDLGNEKLKWQLLADPELWYECPDGSIIVIDEAQQTWRVRSRSAKVPRSITEIETHRHKGFDLFFNTQDPLLVDTNVRKLVWEHTHIKRIFGSEASTLHRWKQRVASPDSKSEYKDALSEKWLFPKEYYGYYKSSELHTAKAQLPWKQFGTIALLACGVIGGISWVFYSFRKQTIVPVIEQPLGQKADILSGQEKVRAGSRTGLFNPWDPEMRKPRAPGWDRTAPIFDRLQRVASQPVVAGCMRMDYGSRIECSCTDPQGHRLSIEVHECLGLVKDGWFDSTRPNVDVKAENIAYLNSLNSAGSASPAPGRPARPSGASAMEPAQEGG